VIDVYQELVGAPPEDLDLYLLAGTGGPDRLAEAFEWRVQRATAVATGAGGTSASLLVSLVLALLKDEVKVAPVLAVGAVVGAVVVGAFGLYMLLRMRTLAREYALAVAALRSLME
jgi:hypothetical protein